MPDDAETTVQVDEAASAEWQEEAARWQRRINAGCEVLYEKIAEAFEPEWRELLGRIYQAMRGQR